MYIIENECGIKIASTSYHVFGDCEAVIEKWRNLIGSLIVLERHLNIKNEAKIFKD